MDAQRAAAQAEAKRVADEARAQAQAAADALAAERAELERMRAELEAKSKPAEQPVAIHVFHPATNMYEQLSAPAEAAADVPLRTGEGWVSWMPAIAIVAAPSEEPSPLASGIVTAVAMHYGVYNKTAARWITERAAEIESLKG